MKYAGKFDHESLLDKCDFKTMRFYDKMDKLISQISLDENILLYLYEIGFKKCADMFAIEKKFKEAYLEKIKTSKMYKSIDIRNKITENLFDGNIEISINIIRESYPQILEDRKLYLKILLLKIPIIIRNSNIFEAVKHLNENICVNFAEYPECLEEIENYSSLIMEINFNNNPNRYFMSNARTKSVSHQISRAIIKLDDPDYIFNDFKESYLLLQYSLKIVSKNDESKDI